MRLTPDFLERLWYGDHPLSTALLPLGWLYGGFMRARHYAYSAGLLPRQDAGVPVIVVGNLTVGGTGKTPLIIWLCGLLLERGRRPGVLSRGYGGRRGQRPQQVRADSSPAAVGDEPVLIARRTGCPVAVSGDRVLAARQLLAHTDCDVLLCDDGLQHLALERDLEIIVIDGDRRLGNGRCLPAGPLREPAGRLASADMVVGNGKAGRNEYLMEYVYGDLRSLAGGARRPLSSLRGAPFHAVAGTGNPGRFFASLRGRGLAFTPHAFPDHHPFIPGDFAFGDDLPIVMTEKDAVKCGEFADGRMWSLPVDAAPSEAFRHRLNVLLEDLFNG